MFGQHQPVGLSQHVQPGSDLGSSLREIPPAFGAAAWAQARRRRARRRPQAIHFVGLFHLMKRIGQRADALRWTNYQEARRLEGVMQDRQDLALQRRSKVDQYVATTDQVQLRERRVFGHIVPGKNAYVADVLCNLVPAFRTGEEPRQPLRRDVRNFGVLVYAGAGFCDRRFADIGGENLERNALSRLVQEFHQADGDRISLLTRCAPGHPDPDGVPGSPILDQSGKHAGLQILEERWLPKECSDGDQTVLAQCGGFLAILLEMPAVVFEVFESAEGHAPLDAPGQGAGLVVREVHPGGAPYQPEDLSQFRISRRPNLLPGVDRNIRMVRDGYQLPRDSGRRQDIIHHAGGDGAARHAIELRGAHFLGEGGAARSLDRLQAQRPIRCGSRHNHAERPASAVRRQGAEEIVDRHVAAADRPVRGVQDSTGNAQIAARRNHVNVIGLGASLAFHLGNRHFGCFGKQLRQMALVTRIEMLNQHECHAGIVRQMREQLREGLQAACGGSHTNNAESTGFALLLGGRRGGLLSRGGWLLWLRRIGRTRRASNPARPATAGLLCQTLPLPFSRRNGRPRSNRSWTNRAREMPFAIGGWPIH